MVDPSNARLVNLLASLSLGLYDDTTATLDAVTGLTGRGSQALLALEEFLGGSTIGRLADVLDLTHSGAVRLVAQLEERRLVRRETGATDRRTVQVRLTAEGWALAATARAARAEVVRETVADLTPEQADDLEALLAHLVRARVEVRMAARARGETGLWWCRACDFTGCGRPEGRCPAMAAAQRAAESRPL